MGIAPYVVDEWIERARTTSLIVGFIVGVLTGLAIAAVT